MIHKLSIRNFKSIRELDLDCRRVNVLIGEPNVGKTNVLEALGLWCPEVHLELKKFTRADQLSDLHFDSNIRHQIEVSCDGHSIRLENLGRERTRFVAQYESHSTPVVFSELDSQLDPVTAIAYGSESLRWQTRYYVFDSTTSLNHPEPDGLRPPTGENLAALLGNDREARQMMSRMFEGGRYSLRIDMGTNEVMFAREDEGIFVTIPYSGSSETLRRVGFFNLAIETNNKSVIVFDEPEAHAYPPFTKRLAERFALDDRGNQFFLTTHSPYMLDSLLSKTPASDLNVILCRMENFETKAYPMDQDQIDQIKEWSMDAFFNFDRLLPEVE